MALIFKSIPRSTLILLLLEVCCFLTAKSYKGPGIDYQRCFSDIFIKKEGASALFQTKCLKCSKNVTTGNIQPHAHVLFFLSPWTIVLDYDAEMIHPLISMAANMHDRGFEVGIVQLKDYQCSSRGDDIPRLLFHSQSCAARMIPNVSVSFFTERVDNINMCDNKTKLINIPAIYSPYDQLDRVPPIINVLRGQKMSRLSKQVDVFVAESTNVAAVLIAEMMKKPLVMVAGPIEVDLIKEKMPEWKGFANFFTSRWKSFDTGLKMGKMNAFRKALDLTPLRMPSEYYEKATALLIHPDYSQSGPLPYNAEAVRPLVAQCVKCDPELENDISNITVLVAPLDLRVESMRAVVRGFIIARQTFQEGQRLHCQDNLTREDQSHPQDSMDCTVYKLLSQVEAVFLTRRDRNALIPELLPPYIRTEKANLVDSLARRPFTVGVMSHCDYNSYLPGAIWMSNLCIARPTDGPLAYNGRELVPYVQPTAEKVSEELVLMLLKMKGTPNVSRLQSKNSAEEIIAKVSHLVKTNNMLTFSDAERRMWLGQPPPTPADENFKSHQMEMRIVMTLIVMLLSLVGMYARTFVSSVKHENQFFVWRRRRRWLEPYTYDLDPALLHFSQWLENKDSDHNKWIAWLQNQEGEQTGTRSRNGGAQNEKNKRKKAVKRR